MAGPVQRRLLQACVALACAVPLAVGATGMIEGPAMLSRVADGVPADLDSHFRYLSGLLLATGLAFASCIRGIEVKTGRFRLLALLVFIGGLGRLISLLSSGVPGPGHLFGLAMELGVVPLLVLWQGRLGRNEVFRR
jgi:uncharacterized protein DUF4345